MKAQFKYSFITGMHIRLPVFAVIAAMILIFGVLGSLGLLPEAAHITAVSLGGVAIAVMMTVGIMGDVSIARRMFRAPDAYLHALTPAPRGNTLLTSLVAMLTLDAVPLTAVIIGEIWLSFNLAGENVWRVVWSGIHGAWREILPWLWYIPCLLLGYLLIVLVILFCVTVKKSLFYKKAASGFLSFLLGCGCFYLISLLYIVLAPFGWIERFGVYITIHLSDVAVLPLTLLTALEVIGLFVLTAKLLERKINI